MLYLFVFIYLLQNTHVIVLFWGIFQGPSMIAQEGQCFITCMVPGLKALFFRYGSGTDNLV